MEQGTLQLIKSIPLGFCQCGCGNKTLLAPRTDARKSWIKGFPKPFIVKHGARLRGIHGQGRRTCTKCYKNLPLSDFYAYRRNRDEKRSEDLISTASQCCQCSRELGAAYRKQNREKSVRSTANVLLQQKYGISIKEYDQLLKIQNGHCAICRRPERAFLKKRRKNLAVDHDHETGRVRGLLCTSCNAALGHFEDNIGFLNAAIEYLSPIQLEEVIGI